MADLATLIARLTDAESALHVITTTGGTVEVRVENDKVTYGPVNLDALRTYVRQLRADIIVAGGTCADGGLRRRPLTPFFGG